MIFATFGFTSIVKTFLNQDIQCQNRLLTCGKPLGGLHAGPTGYLDF